ncbi:MAG: cytochrome c [Rhodocyclaceae bacterium]
MTQIPRFLMLAAVAGVLAAGAVLAQTGQMNSDRTPGRATLPPGHPGAAQVAPLPLPSTADPLVHQGAYLARVGDCVACHTAPGGAPFAGGLGMNTPFGTIYSTNITPHRQTGIGAYSFEQFARAVQHGVRADGQRLYPAMPYPSFARVSEDDMRALYAYFQRGVPAVDQTNRHNALPWPFSMRWVVMGWNMLFYRDGPATQDAERPASWNRGAYLVEGLGHCGACHTPHGVFGQEKADGFDDRQYLGGFTLDNWHAPSLRGEAGQGLGQWSAQDIAQYLRTGRAPHSVAFGAMTDVINNSTQHLNEGDALAIAEFLKSFSPAAATPATAQAAASHEPNTLRAGRIDSAGAQVYLNNCNACHRSDGSGAMRAFPPLRGNSAVVAQDPTSLIRLVLEGSRMPSTAAAPAPLAMPDFGWRLSDSQIADVLTYVRGRWGNQSSAVTTAQVADVRKALAKASAR